MSLNYTNSNYLASLAASKKSNKLDPKAKVRSRGKVVFPAESSKVKDKKDHFPINDADQARNALARAGQYDSVPPWYKGSLSELKEAVRKAVHKHYKGIEMQDKKSSRLEKIIKKADIEAQRLLEMPVFPLQEQVDISSPNLENLNDARLINPFDLPVSDLDDLSEFDI